MRLNSGREVINNYLHYQENKLSQLNDETVDNIYIDFWQMLPDSKIVEAKEYIENIKSNNQDIKNYQHTHFPDNNLSRIINFIKLKKLLIDNKVKIFQTKIEISNYPTTNNIKFILLNQLLHEEQASSYEVRLISKLIDKQSNLNLSAEQLSLKNVLLHDLKQELLSNFLTDVWAEINCFINNLTSYCSDFIIASELGRMLRKIPDYIIPHEYKKIFIMTLVVDFRPLVFDLLTFDQGVSYRVFGQTKCKWKLDILDKYVASDVSNLEDKIMVYLRLCYDLALPRDYITTLLKLIFVQDFAKINLFLRENNEILNTYNKLKLRKMINIILNNWNLDFTASKGREFFETILANHIFKSSRIQDIKNFIINNSGYQSELYDNLPNTHEDLKCYFNFTVSAIYMREHQEIMRLRKIFDVENTLRSVRKKVIDVPLPSMNRGLIKQSSPNFYDYLEPPLYNRTPDVNISPKINNIVFQSTHPYSAYGSDLSGHIVGMMPYFLDSSVSKNEKASVLMFLTGTYISHGWHSIQELRHPANTLAPELDFDEVITNSISHELISGMLETTDYLLNLYLKNQVNNITKVNASKYW